VKAKMALIALAAIVIVAAGCSEINKVVPVNALSTLGVYGVNGTAGQYCTVLFGGQTIDAGSVCVEVIDNGDTEDLCITYTTTGGWELVEAHLWVGGALVDMPQNRKGNPQVGLFPYHSGDITGETTYTFHVDLAEFGGEDGLCGEELLAAAHAALRKDNGDGTYQTETGWGDGDRMVDRGNWATYFGIEFTCGAVPPGYKSETAFAYNCVTDYRTCFIGMDDGQGGTFNRWGWTNGPLGEGTYYFDIYAGAGQCDISKGTLVGLLTVDYDGTTAVVTYNTCGGYTMTETHLYVGNDPLPWYDHPQDPSKSGWTIAPGQYPYIHEGLPTVQQDIHTVSVTGEIYVVAHAVVWGDYSGDCGERGCNPPEEPCTGEWEFVDWGEYSVTHIYSISTRGTGANVCFRVFDGQANVPPPPPAPIPTWYPDNIGSITVKIYDGSVLLEEITVPANLVDGVCSATVLDASKTYSIEASGTWQDTSQPNHYLDAEYGTFDTWETYMDGTINWGPDQKDIQIKRLCP
jgi:hypothetical protein